jgi:hypothetical protein
MIGVMLFALACSDENWSKAYPAPVSDSRAMLLRNYGVEPFRSDLPLYRRITNEVEMLVIHEADLEAEAKTAMNRFDVSGRVSDLAKASLLRYYCYSQTRRLNVVPSYWYENAWAKCIQNPAFKTKASIDIDPHDYWLSRIRFLADSCQYQDLPIRQIGYRLYKFSTKLCYIT